MFNTAEQAAIEALIPEGGGGGGASFPMVEGVWYDQTYATPMQVSTSTADADTLIGGVFLIPTDCTISKVGLFPSAAPSASATALVGIYAISDAGIVSAQVGTTATVAVADSWTEGIVESATEIAVTAGWYFIGVASDEELTITGFEVDSVVVGLLGFDADAGHSYGYTLSEEDVHVALPATLVGAELALNFNAPQILFQITHD